MKVNAIVNCLHLNELIVVPVTTPIDIIKISSELRISLLSFTSEFLFKNTIRKPNIGFFEIFIAKFPSKVVLKNDESLLLSDLLALIGNEKYKINENVFFSEIQLLNFNLILYLIAGIYSENSYDVRTRYNRKEKLVFSFLEILDIHCREQHAVKFYSNTLLISEGHLSKVVKQITNKTIKEFIKEAIILEAKILLQNGDLTILQIIEELHFSNSSSFSNFFKKSTSMSPSEYRLKLKL
ncbi:helix-turn-helix domain-containing protein [Flavobacterium humi]|nr:AraC family transcriptional regulator [Flavobacterium humi]